MVGLLLLSFLLIERVFPHFGCEADGGGGGTDVYAPFDSAGCKAGQRVLYVDRNTIPIQLSNERSPSMRFAVHCPKEATV
jgi:hypothetical protein